jgi:succinate dehydrogenase / fumarate reductase, iron-sulfur subunit
MATFTLPKNSKIRKTGELHQALTGGKKRPFKVYRYDPDKGENPRYDTFEIDTDADLPPVLPRRHLRVLCDEYQRQKWSGLYHCD